MSLVEQKYNESLDRMSGKERIERTCSIFRTVREMLSLKASREFPGLTNRQLKKKVAEQLYLSDEKAQILISLVQDDD